MREKTVKRGNHNGHPYELKRRGKDAVAAGAASYVLYVDGEFYCSCDSRAAAADEIENI